MRSSTMLRAATVVLTAALHSSIGAAQRNLPMGHPGPAVPAPLRDTAAARFRAVAREAAARFRSRDSAVARGYRRIGMDFPAMGEHWVNASLIISARLDAAEPAMLSYVTIDGTPTLAGVAYAMLLDSGRSPPNVPGAGDMWHAHNGTLAEESAAREHHGGLVTNGGMQLVVLHLWTNVSNPDGPFNAENWALPFVRLGLSVPSPLPRRAARALALLSGGREYFTLLADSSGSSTELVARSLDEAAMMAADPLEHARHTGSLTPDDVRDLDAVWLHALDLVTRRVGADAARRMNGDG